MGPPTYSHPSRPNHGPSADYDPLSASKNDPTASRRSPIRRRGSIASSSSSASSGASASIVSRRFRTLREAIAACEPGEPFSVEGDAPSPITHADHYARLRRELRPNDRPHGPANVSHAGRQPGELVRLSIPELRRLERHGTLGMGSEPRDVAARFTTRPLVDPYGNEFDPTRRTSGRSNDDEAEERYYDNGDDEYNDFSVNDRPVEEPSDPPRSGMQGLQPDARQSLRIRSMLEQQRLMRLSRAAAQSRLSLPAWLATGPSDGLGDRPRSPSMADEQDWETLRASIPPDGRLPSASATSSFASSAGGSATQHTTRESSVSTAPSTMQQSHRPSFMSRIAAQRARIASALDQSPFTSNAASHFDDNSLLPPSDITYDQLARGVICDDAQDTEPAFTPSLGPLRRVPGRNGSPDQEFFEIRAPNGGPRYRVSSALAARTLPPLANSVGRGMPYSRHDRPNASAESARPSFRRSSSTDPAHLRAPEEQAAPTTADAAARDQAAPESPSVEQLQPVADHLLVVPGTGEPLRRYRLGPGVLPANLEPTPPASEGGSGSGSGSPWRRRSMARVDARLAAVREQHDQLRRINELLQCDREVPAHLWELVGLDAEIGQELGVDVFEI